jgi:4-hydroxybenzoate polyprenyltransferase
MFVGLVLFGFVAQLGLIYYAGLGLIAPALWYEHRAARQLDIGAINRAFFQSNAFVSAVFLLAVCVDVLSRS